MSVIITPGGASRPTGYQEYTFADFNSWDAFTAFIDEARKLYPTPDATVADRNFGDFIQRELDIRTSGRGNDAYGILGRHPRTYQEALDRNKFIYWDEYKKLKSELFDKIQKRLAKSSVAEVMKPKMVYNDRQLGEFIFDRAAMALEPMIYFYSLVHKREINLETEEIYEKGDKIYLKSDDTKVIRAIKVEKEDGEIIYMELKGEKTLSEASEIGIVSVSSSNKKVYLYKEKKPRMYNSVKLVTAMTMGGFTNWVNDFWTGMSTVLCLEILESLGYSVEIEVALGGGRCGGCSKKLLFRGQYIRGRRFIMIKLKDFNEQTDMESLLYMLCDPSFHNVKFVGMLNTIFSVYGDQISTSGNPAGTWHGIEEGDLVFPIGSYVKAKAALKGQSQLLDIYLHRIRNKIDVEGSVLKAIIGCEEINRQALLKLSQHDFGIGA